MELNQTSHDDYVYSLAASPNFRKDRLVFAGKRSGLYLSMDKGRTWNDAFASFKLAGPFPVSSAAVASACETTYVFACLEGQILRSLDAGQTWQSAKLDTPAPLVTALALSPDFARDGTLLAATVQDGIFRSTDRGVTWTGWNFGLFEPNINALTFTDAQTILAGAQSGIFRSSNAGRSWRDHAFPIDCAPVLCLAVNRRGTIYAGTESEGLQVSRDGGQTWEQLIEGTVEQILLDADEKILLLRDGELLVSKTGKSWKAARPGFEPAADISDFTTLPGLESLLVGLSNGEIVKL